MNYLFKNDTLLKHEQVTISINDRSFRYGDGCFETIPFVNRKCLHLNDHLKRLKHCLEAIKISLDLSKIHEQVDQLFIKNSIESGIIRIICSRGESSEAYLPKNSKAYYLIEAIPYDFKQSESISLFVSTYIHYSNNQIPNAGKINSALLYVLARIEAEENNCEEALLLNQDSSICEGSSSNIFFMKNSILHFPNNKEDFIEGITENIIKKITSYKIKHGIYKLSDIKQADAVYISNSVRGIIKVKSIQPINMNFNCNENDPLIREYENYVKNYYGK